MGTLIHKCCTCGTIMSIEKRGDVDGERTSHGYCSNECSNPEERQVLVWSDKYSMYVLERAFYVKGNYYFNQKPLLNYLFLSGTSVYGASVSPDKQHLAEDILCDCKSSREAANKAKEMGRKQKTTIIL